MKDYKKINQAYELYKQYKKDGNYNDALTALTQYVKLSDENNLVGNYYYKLERMQMLALHNSFPKEKQQKIDSNYNSCKDAISAGVYETAIKSLEKYYTLTQGTTVECYLFSASINRRLGDYEKAQNDINMALEINPHSPSVYIELIELNIVTQEYDEALKNINEFLKLDKKTSLFSYLYQFEVYYLKGDTIKANSILNEGCKKLSIKKRTELKEKSIEFLKRPVPEPINIEAKIDYLKECESFLIPDENNIVRPRLIREYIKNLNLNSKDEALLKLRVAKLLQENRYSEYADSYITEVEQTKNKTNEVKRELIETKNRIKILKYV